MLYIRKILSKLYCVIIRPLCLCIAPLPVVGANQNHLGALLGENSQTNLSHQVAEVRSINKPFGSCHKSNRAKTEREVCCGQV